MVYINNALVTWDWSDLKNPILAIMSFIYRLNKDTGKWCLFELHSS